MFKNSKAYWTKKNQISKRFSVITVTRIWYLILKMATIYSIYLSKILECLLIAEAEGQVPEIDEIWWNELEELYPNIENLRIELKSEE